MNKLAAEKIAQEYYDLGTQLALGALDTGHTKTASKALQKILGGAANTGIGIGAGLAGGGLGAAGTLDALQLLKAHGLIENLGNEAGLAMLLGSGAGAATALKHVPTFKTPELFFKKPGLVSDGGLRLR